jgi:site-specific recombinase XerD
MQQGMVQSNPMGRLEPVEQIERLPRPLDPDDVTRILKAIPASNLRNRAIFMLFSETGMRVEEALSIHYADLDLTQDDEKIRVFGKGQRERTVLLAAAPESIRLLRRYLKHSHITAGSIFRGNLYHGGSPLSLDYSVLRKAWQKYCKQAGVQALSNIGFFGKGR